jgi:uncharacterized protein YndB with AHSA1/START domain
MDGATAATRGDEYRLGHRWLIKGPIDVVFDVLSHGDRFPEWWAPCFRTATTEDGAEPAVGNRIRYRVRARLPYDLDWDLIVRELEPPHTIETDAYVRLSGRFPMRGSIRFTLGETADGVEVINDQRFTTDRSLPRPFRALAQRAFAYNHAWAMRIGGRGLQKAVDEAIAARVTSARVA